MDFLKLYDSAEMTAEVTGQLREANRKLELADSFVPRDKSAVPTPKSSSGACSTDAPEPSPDSPKRVVRRESPRRGMRLHSSMPHRPQTVKHDSGLEADRKKAAIVEDLQSALESAKELAGFPEHLLPFVDEVTSACSRLHAELEWLRECARMTSPEVEVYAAGLNSQLCHKIWT